MADKAKHTEEKPLDEKSESELKRETKARLRRLSPAAASELLDERVSGKVTGPVAEFVAFIRERAVVGLAVGFVVATQVQAVVKQFIVSFVDPLFQLFGGKSLNEQKFTLHLNGHQADFIWGGLVYALLNFIVIVLTIYVVVKVFKLDKLDKPA